MPIVEKPGPGGSIRWQIQNPSRRNAIDPEGLSFIEETAAALRGQIVILEGETPGPFCAGFDLTHLSLGENDALPDEPLIAAAAAMANSDATFIAAVRGYAIGAGVELLSCCDLVVAAEDAWLQVPAARLGVLYHGHGLTRLRATFGSALARRLIFLGERIGAPQAHAAGAVTHLVTASELETSLASIVTQLEACAPQVLAGHRRWFRAAREGTAPPAQEHQATRRALYANLKR